MSTNPTSPPASQIIITPASAFIDENAQILLSGFASNVHVTLHGSQETTQVS